MFETVIHTCINQHSHTEEVWPDINQPCPTCGEAWKRSTWRPFNPGLKQATHGVHYKILDHFDEQLGRYVFDTAQEKKLMKELGACDATGAWDRPKPDYPAKGTIFSFGKK